MLLKIINYIITIPPPKAKIKTNIITINTGIPISRPKNTDFLKDLSLINIGNNKFRGNINQEKIPTKTPRNERGKLLIESYSTTSVCSVSVTGKEA